MNGRSEKKMDQDKLRRMEQAGGIVVEDATQKRDRLFEDARREVVEHGEKTGNERLVLLDAKTGEMLEAINGIADELMLTDTMMALIEDAKQSIRLIHNHPKSSSLSEEDIIKALLPGVDCIEAIGHDGSRYKIKPKITNFVDLEATLLEANKDVMRRLMDLVNTKKINLANADQLFIHVINLALAKSGVVDYEYQLSDNQDKAFTDSGIELSKIIDRVANNLKNLIHLTRRASHDDYRPSSHSF